MKTVRKNVKLKAIAGGFYTPEDYTSPPAITPTKLRRVTTLLLRKVKLQAPVS